VDKAVAAIRTGLPEADLIALLADNGTACEKTIAELPSVDVLVNEAVGFFDETDEEFRRTPRLPYSGTQGSGIGDAS
jgi:3-oxoacyl-[acyl-carrier protein] reductase